jgi:hypothetical protein
VRAGILNDLGSGSHVDLCVIDHEGYKQWRERLKAPKRRVSAPQLSAQRPRNSLGEVVYDQTQEVKGASCEHIFLGQTGIELPRDSRRRRFSAILVEKIEVD